MTTYLCGGINSLSDAECKDWRILAKELLRCDTLDPMRRDYRGKEADAVNQIVGPDLDDIAASEVILVNATRPSWGTAMEIVYAHQSRKFIVAFTGQASISPWLTFHCDQIRPTLEEACEVINNAA